MRNVFLLFLLFGSIYCKAQADSLQKITPGDFEKAISYKNVQVLDVRTYGEYTGGHIKNALQSDWTNSMEFNTRIGYVDKNRPVYIYCQVGGRSTAAADWMRKNGFMQVIELLGGMNAWKKAGKPVEGASNEAQMTLEQYLSKIPANKTTLVDLGAEWCPPCVKMRPVIAELENLKDRDFLVLKIDAGIHTGLLKALNIDPIPVFIIYKNGKESWRKEGVVTREELLAHIR